MKRLKVSFMLLVLTLLVASAVFNRVANSQGQSPSTYPNTPLTAAQSAALETTTNQADVAAAEDQCFTTDVGECPPNTFCEGADPNSTANFTFATGESARPPGADPDQTTHAAEAPAAFDNHTNSEAFLPQGSMIPKFPAAKPTPGTFEADKFIFSIVEETDDGLGPVYNAQSCRECHQNPVTGAISQITELRAGHNDANGNFIDAPGGSLINDRAIDPRAQERVPPLYTAGIVGDGPPIAAEEPVRTFRTSLNLLGDGFVEAVQNGTLVSIANTQPTVSNGQVHGQAIPVPVMEAACQEPPPCTGRFCPEMPTQICIERVGRFGWKDQIPSLLTFAGDAYLNEMGITNFLIPVENTTLGRPVTSFDTVSDQQACEDDETVNCGEDPEKDIVTFATFIRATKAPPQDAGIQHDQRFAADIAAGRQLFSQMPNGPGFSCSICHVPAILTAPAETGINAGKFVVPDGLGFKVIRPFGDFLLHDIGTGDGIVQNGGQCTRNMVRTAPLWGVRTRTRLMHDGQSLTFREAILRHQGEAAAVTAAFQQLSEQQKRQIIMFLESL